VKLSGGERQRVALARAFLADAPILVLDEATAGLDSESEAMIQEAMGRLLTGRTALVIAHRLSTVRAMDRILVFDRGRVAEEGTHAALLARPGGIYAGLFRIQASGLAEAAE
jgi:ATP-binding cassette subfamily B protein